MVFTTSTMLYNDCHYLVPGHVHYPKGRPCTHSVVTPIAPFLPVPTITPLLPVSVDLPMISVS